MCSRIPGWNTLSDESRSAEASALRARAEALIKGCIVHWKRSLHKIKQVIGKKHLYRFEMLINVFESERTTLVEFLQAVERIRADFPEVRPWLAWWILPGNGSMIFPAMQKMPAELRAKLPNSTNASESNHWLLNRAVGFGFDLWEGIRRLYRFQRETEMLYAAILAGHVDARFQGSKPKPKSRIKWQPNDGRAPDTRERLEAIEKIEGEFNTLNAALTDAERWDAVNSAPLPARAQFASPKSSPPTLLSRQSYRWDDNSCFIDASLEAHFRAFVAMGDATRKEFFRRIRVEAPKTGLRYVVEHLWLRGLLSGSIASSDLTAKNSSKPDKRKLEDALSARQLNVKNFIETKWDGGVFSAGMASCSRTWLNQMVNTDTTRGVQKYFGISRAVNYSCSAKHTVAKPTPWISVENGIRHDDLFIAQEYMPHDSHRPSLADYLIHAIPRARTGTSRSVIWPALHLSPPIPCSHPACNAEATAESISTEWPLILRIDPIRHSDNMRDEPLVTDLSCPLTLNLGFDVEYISIARVIFIPPVEGGVGHYLHENQTQGQHISLQRSAPQRIANRTRTIASSRRPRSSHLLCGISSNVQGILGEVEFDYAKIPSPLPADPIPVSDDSDDEIGQMLVDSITTPTKKTPILPRLFSSLRSDKFFTPEQSPAPPAPYDIPNAPADTSDETKSATPSPVFCEPYGANLPEGDDDPDEVQCEKCKLWSHFKCYPGVDWNDSIERFFYRGCRNEVAAEFISFQPGQVVMLPSPEPGDWKAPHVLWYPADFIQHHKQRKGKFNEYEFRWSNCNDGTVFHSSLSDLPVLMLRTHFRGRKFLEEIQDVTLTAEMIGTIHLPFYMKPDDPGHQHPILTSIFDAASHQVAGILADWNNLHPVVASFTEYFAGKKKHLRSREASNWMDTLGLVSTPELEAVLTDPLISLMDHPALLNLTEEECQTRVMGVGSVLLQFLAVQHELGESLNLNGDLVEDLKDESVVACLPDGDKALNAMFSAIPSTSTRSGVLVRQMLAFKRDHTIFDEELRPPFFQRDRPSHFPPTALIPVVRSARDPFQLGLESKERHLATRWIGGTVDKFETSEAELVAY
ncbi:hypothetical protein DFH09DRAFT_1081864 [Mycena vulgaris]|nr:hypothetical protein DFH09DRAFT_1081864 [Mycena vulgaris]